MIISNAHQIVALPATEKLITLFPKAKTITLQGMCYLALPHNPQTTIVLRNLGHEIPFPVLSHYEFTGRSKPFDAQRKTVAMLTSNFRAYVLSGMGTGKSKCALWSADYLMNCSAVPKALIVAPLSTLKFTWGREIIDTLPHRTFSVLHGTKKQRLNALAIEADFYIINHNGLKVIHKELEKRPDINLLIIDELATYRNAGASLSKAMQAFAQRFQWAWGLTGGPIPNEPTDVWAQCKIITPGSVPKYFTRYRDELMVKINQFKWAPKPDAIERAFKAMQPAVRFTLDDILELPECIERVVDVELGERQQKVYAGLLKHAYALIGKHEITAANQGAVENKLLQISTGWVYSQDKGIVQLDGDHRLDTLIEYLFSTDTKTIVFVPFIHALEGIQKRLTNEGISVSVVSGDTAPGLRAETFNLFQNTDKPRVLLAHPRCMSHGLTLTAADTIIWYAPPNADLETFDQANARIRRIGQHKKQQILMFQGTSIERKYYAKLRSKQRTQGVLLEMFEERTEESR